MLNNEVLLHDVKVHVWCAISAVRTIGSIPPPETINTHLYVTHIVTIPLCEHVCDCKRQCNSSCCSSIPNHRTIQITRQGQFFTTETYTPPHIILEWLPNTYMDNKTTSTPSVLTIIGIPYSHSTEVSNWPISVADTTATQLYSTTSTYELWCHLGKPDNAHVSKSTMNTTNTNTYTPACTISTKQRIDDTSTPYTGTSTTNALSNSILSTHCMPQKVYHTCDPTKSTVGHL
jgi:hypothetical protein